MRIHYPRRRSPRASARALSFRTYRARSGWSVIEPGESCCSQAQLTVTLPYVNYTYLPKSRSVSGGKGITAACHEYFYGACNDMVTFPTMESLPAVCQTPALLQHTTHFLAMEAYNLQHPLQSTAIRLLTGPFSKCQHAVASQP